MFVVPSESDLEQRREECGWGKGEGPKRPRAASAALLVTSHVWLLRMQRAGRLVSPVTRLLTCACSRQHMKNRGKGTKSIYCRQAKRQAAWPSSAC